MKCNFSISISQEVLNYIDQNRGDVGRSKFIERMLTDEIKAREEYKGLEMKIAHDCGVAV